MSTIIGATSEPDLKQQLKAAKDAYQELLIGARLDIAEFALQAFLLATFAKAELNALRDLMITGEEITEESFMRANIKAIQTATATIQGQVSTPILASAAEVDAVRRRR